MKLSPAEKAVVREVAKSAVGLSVYAIGLRLRLGPSQLVRLVHRLIHLELLRLDENRVELTERCQALLDTTPQLFLVCEQKPWRNVPEEFKIPAIPKNEPFLPSIREVDPGILPLRYKELFKETGEREPMTRTLECSRSFS